MVAQTARERFLTAYSELQTVAGAARKAQIHRATIYRWRADPAFAEAMDAAWQAGYQRWRCEVYVPQEAERLLARERRNAELLPLRQELAAYARSCRCR